jgi:hypothetical protein
MRMSEPANTASKAAMNVLSRSWIKNRNLVGGFAELYQQVAGLLGDPGFGGKGGDPGDVHVGAAVLDHHQDVEAAAEGGVDVGGVDARIVGLRGQELSPGRVGPPRGHPDGSAAKGRPRVPLIFGVGVRGWGGRWA